MITIIREACLSLNADYYLLTILSTYISPKIESIYTIILKDWEEALMYLSNVKDAELKSKAVNYLSLIKEPEDL